MAQRRAQACHELADAERLVDEVIGAEIERLDLLRLAVARGKDDNGNVRPLPHLLDEILAIAIGQPQVEHDDVGRLAGDALQGLGEGPRAGD